MKNMEMENELFTFCLGNLKHLINRKFNTYHRG